MKIALIGRPNVGKSTLFNRLVGFNSAITGDLPGITRDYKCSYAELFGIHFQVIDTPGVDPFSKEELSLSMNQGSLSAIKGSDIIFFLIDANEGITEYDKAVASWLRKSFQKIGNRRIVLIKNKCEGYHNLNNESTLGFGDGIAISAEHNLGLEGIYDYLLSLDILSSCSDEDNKESLKIAIVGRPNVGKSTLINSIIGEKRLITGDISGLTRDSIVLNWKFKEKNILLIDTAGQRKKSKIQDNIESLSVNDSWKYIRKTNIVVIVMDITSPFEKQDINIARKAFDEGKIIIFALNKSDIVQNPHYIQDIVIKRISKEFSQSPNAPCLLVSAKEKLGLARIFNVSFNLFEKWSKRIPTGELNKWFQYVIDRNPPPLVNGLPIKLKYIVQTHIKPPTFTVFANRVEHLPTSYKRYLLNSLRKNFDFNGIPLRIFIRQRNNPFS